MASTGVISISFSIIRVASSTRSFVLGMFSKEHLVNRSLAQRRGESLLLSPNPHFSGFPYGSYAISEGTFSESAAPIFRELHWEMISTWSRAPDFAQAAPEY